MSVIKETVPVHVPPSQQSAQGPVPKPGEPVEPFERAKPEVGVAAEYEDDPGDPREGLTRRPGIHRSGAKGRR